MYPMLVYFGNNASDCNTVTHDRHLDHRLNVTDCVREKLSVNEVSFRSILPETEYEACTFGTIYSCLCGHKMPKLIKQQTMTNTKGPINNKRVAANQRSGWLFCSKRAFELHVDDRFEFRRKHFAELMNYCGLIWFFCHSQKVQNMLSNCHSD